MTLEFILETYRLTYCSDTCSHTSRGLEYSPFVLLRDARRLAGWKRSMVLLPEACLELCSSRSASARVLVSQGPRQLIGYYTVVAGLSNEPRFTKTYWNIVNRFKALQQPILYSISAAEKNARCLELSPITSILSMCRITMSLSLMPPMMSPKSWPGCRP